MSGVPVIHKALVHVDGLGQGRRNSIANTPELHLSCTNRRGFAQLHMEHCGLWSYLPRFMEETFLGYFTIESHYYTIAFLTIKWNGFNCKIEFTDFWLNTEPLLYFVLWVGSLLYLIAHQQLISVTLSYINLLKWYSGCPCSQRKVREFSKQAKVSNNWEDIIDHSHYYNKNFIMKSQSIRSRLKYMHQTEIYIIQYHSVYKFMFVYMAKSNCCILSSLVVCMLL